MIIQEYKITHLADSVQDPIYQWQIQLRLAPTWLERTFMAKIFSETKTLKGSCTSWKWGDGTDAGYFWKIWALNAVKRHNKGGGTTYVNSRFNRSQDE